MWSLRFSTFHEAQILHIHFAAMHAAGDVLPLQLFAWQPQGPWKHAFQIWCFNVNVHFLSLNILGVSLSSSLWLCFQSIKIGNDFIFFEIKIQIIFYFLTFQTRVFGLTNQIISHFLHSKHTLTLNLHALHRIIKPCCNSMHVKESILSLRKLISLVISYQAPRRHPDFPLWVINKSSIQIKLVNSSYVSINWIISLIIGLYTTSDFDWSILQNSIKRA